MWRWFRTILKEGKARAMPEFNAVADMDFMIQVAGEMTDEVGFEILSAGTIEIRIYCPGSGSRSQIPDGFGDCRVILRLASSSLMRPYFYRLLAELFVIVLVPVIFHFVTNRLHAGIIAGSIFIALGFYVIWPGIQNAVGRRALSFWAGCLHLSISAFPLFLTRLMQADSKFEDVRILGMSGPDFHRFSTVIYSLMLVATVVDVALAYRRRAKLKTKR